MNAGNRTYNLKKLKEEYPHLLVLKDSTINFGDVKVILGQDCYHLHRAIDYRKCGNAKPWAVRTKLGWMLSGPLPQRESAKLATENLFAAELDPLAGQMKTCWSIDLYTLNCSVSGMFEANKKNSQDIFFVERKWQEVSTKTLLVEIKQVWQEEMQLVAGDHNIVKQGAKKEFSITEEKNEHERVAITSNFQTSEKICVTLDLPKQSIGVASVQQLVKEKYSTQLQAMNVTVNTLTLEEGKKCSQLDRENGFVNECQIELYEVPSGKAIYRRHFSGLLERDQPAEENASNGTTSVNVSFGRKHDVDLKEKMPDKIIPNDSENRNNRLGNGNSGMDAVAQANPNAYTQLSSGHRKQFEKRVLKCEHSSNLLHGMFESVQLTTGILSAKIVRNFGKPQMVVNAQLKRIYSFPPMKPYDGTALIKFARIVSSCVNVLTQFNNVGDLNSEAVLGSATRKLTLDMKTKWLTYVKQMDLYQPGLAVFSEWLNDIADV